MSSNRVWFTSDLHFGHKNVIKYSNRPFANVDEMDEAIVENWNKRVQPGDRVYLLGDVSFRESKKTNELLHRLKGEIFLIMGNHDEKRSYVASPRFVWVKDYFYLRYGEHKIILSHYPFLTWRGCHRGTFHLHGHCHGSLNPEFNKYARRMDVGVDCTNYAPISFEEVKEILEKREFRPVDHHDERE